MRFSLQALYVGLCMVSFSAAADYAVLDNGEILKTGHYKLTGTAQFLTESGGANVAARMDAPINDEFGVRGLVGVGKTDLFLGALGKWMPIPDIDKQPAIGLNAGLLYLNDSGVRDLVVRFEPLVSKRFMIDTTALTPYASIPLGVRMRDSDNVNDRNNDVTSQFVVGSQVEFEQWKNLHFIGEIGLEMNQAPSYVSVGAILYFDAENGISLN